MNLYIFPHAGGFKHSYDPFKDIFDKSINLIPFEYPGRMQKDKEAQIADIDALAEHFVSSHLGELEGEYALWGHSMGALVAYTVARKIAERKEMAQPKHLFVSGHKAPSHAWKRKKVHNLPKAAFWEKVADLNGMPAEIMNDKGFLDFIEPIIRSDFKAVETFDYKGPAELDIPIAVFFGLDEKIEFDDVKDWQKETKLNPVNIQCMPGSHFFIFEDRRKIAQAIMQELFVLSA